MAITKIRNEELLLNETYEILLKLSKDIQNSKESSAELVGAYTSLLDIYFSIIDDGF